MRVVAIVQGREYDLDGDKVSLTEDGYGRVTLEVKVERSSATYELPLKRGIALPLKNGGLLVAQNPDFRIGPTPTRKLSE